MVLCLRRNRGLVRFETMFSLAVEIVIGCSRCIAVVKRTWLGRMRLTGEPQRQRRRGEKTTENDTVPVSPVR